LGDFTDLFKQGGRQWLGFELRQSEVGFVGKRIQIDQIFLGDHRAHAECERILIGKASFCGFYGGSQFCYDCCWRRCKSFRFSDFGGRGIRGAADPGRAVQRSAFFDFDRIEGFYGDFVRLGLRLLCFSLQFSERLLILSFWRVDFQFKYRPDSFGFFGL